MSLRACKPVSNSSSAHQRAVAAARCAARRRRRAQRWRCCRIWVGAACGLHGGRCRCDRAGRRRCGRPSVIRRCRRRVSSSRTAHCSRPCTTKNPSFAQDDTPSCPRLSMYATAQSTRVRATAALTERALPRTRMLGSRAVRCSMQVCRQHGGAPVLGATMAASAGGEAQEQRPQVRAQ